MQLRPSSAARSLAATTLSLVVMACADAPSAVRPTDVGPGDPSFAAQGGSGRGIPGRFIVTLEPRQNPRAVAAAYGITPDYFYETAVVGFAGTIAEAARAGLLRDNRIVRIEQDQVVSIAATQTNATWGLDRIDQRSLPLNGTYTYDQTGAGVRAYIIDTGILTGHVDFGSRATNGFDAFTDGRNGQDCNGHGTHVAGTVGGTAWGVAKSTTLVGVRVLDCQGSGTTSGVIAGVDWVAANHVKPAVANMSLGGGASSTLDNAVASLIATGVTTAVAAGNSNANACNYSPARVSSALTVGATTSTDARASYSNFGSCLDLFAPGSSITSAWYTSTTATNTISGTSMASPHVAGAAALYLQTTPGASPSAVGSAVLAAATTGKVTSAGTGSPNLLLYSLFSGGTTEPPPTEPPPTEPPPASFTLSVRAYKVSGRQTADLTWSGSTATSIDVFRDNAKLTATANDGAYTDNINRRGGGSYTYRVCNAGTSTCTANVTASF